MLLVQALDIILLVFFGGFAMYCITWALLRVMLLIAAVVVRLFWWSKDNQTNDQRLDMVCGGLILFCGLGMCYMVSVAVQS